MKLRKAAGMLCCGTAVSVGLLGCGTTRDSSTTATGAQVGAAAGAIIGYQRDGLRGAILGALVGGAIGAAVGKAIEHVREASAAEVQMKYGKQDKLEIEDLALSKDVWRGGDQGTVTIRYAVVTAEQDKSIPTVQTVHYIKDGRSLATNREDRNLTAGAYRTVFPLNLPRGSDEGEYKVVALLDGLNKNARAEKAFRVTYARGHDDQLRVVYVSPL